MALGRPGGALCGGCGEESAWAVGERRREGRLAVGVAVVVVVVVVVAAGGEDVSARGLHGRVSTFLSWAAAGGEGRHTRLWGHRRRRGDPLSRGGRCQHGAHGPRQHGHGLVVRGPACHGEGAGGAGEHHDGRSGRRGVSRLLAVTCRVSEPSDVRQPTLRLRGRANHRRGYANLGPH